MVVPGSPGAPTGSRLYRGLAARFAVPRIRRLPIGDTADCQSALRGCPLTKRRLGFPGIANLISFSASGPFVFLLRVLASSDLTARRRPRLLLHGLGRSVFSFEQRQPDGHGRALTDSAGAIDPTARQLNATL